MTVPIAAFSVWISGGAAGDLDDLGEFADLQRDGDPVGAAHLNVDVLALERPESGERRLERVDAGRDGRHHVEAGFVGLTTSRTALVP